MLEGFWLTRLQVLRGFRSREVWRIGTPVEAFIFNYYNRVVGTKYIKISKLTSQYRQNK